MTTRVKVSGLTRPGDVELAIALGAWALGFAVVGETQRPGAQGPASTASVAALLSTAQAAELVAVARARAADVLTVAYVPGADPSETVRVATAVGATAVEVDAGSDAAAVRAAMRTGGLATAALIAARDAPGSDEADFVVFPQKQPGVPAEAPVPWDPATRPAFKRVIVAGDVDARMVGEVVRRVHPFAIDVGRVVQARAGVLDAARLAQLMAALTAADAQQPWQVEPPGGGGAASERARPQ